MSFGETVLLGALAGFTIFLGLPVGRLQSLSSRTRVALAMFSVGVLVFLLVDVLAHGFEIAEGAVEEFKDGDGSFLHAAWLTLLLLGGFTLGSAGLGITERRMRARNAPPPMAGGATDDAAPSRSARAGSTPRAAQALRTGLIIAAAIGLHNFAEGLAIGVSAQAGRDRPRDRPDHRLRAPQRDRGLRHRRPPRRRPAVLALARARRPDRRRPDVRRLDGRLQRHLRAARAGVLRPRGRRDPLRRSARSGTACAATATAKSA